MKLPDLSKAYELVLFLEKRKDTKLDNRDSIIEEIDDKNEALHEDIEHFNQLVDDLHRQKDTLNDNEYADKLVHIRMHAMNIYTEFSNFREELDDAFGQAFKEQ